MKIIIYSLLILMFVNANLFAEEQNKQAEMTQAEKEQAKKDRLVLDKAMELMNGLLSPEQYSELHILAYSAIAANYCDGIEIDQTEYKEGLDKLNPEKTDEMTEEEKEFFINHFMFTYGLTVGVYMHEGAQDLEQFCSDARDRMKNEKLHYWVKETADKPK